jgi:hypothetical protein
MKMISKQIYWYDFHIWKLNDFKVIYHLYSQCLTPILSKRFFFTKPEGVYAPVSNNYDSSKDKVCMHKPYENENIQGCLVLKNFYNSCEEPKQGLLGVLNIN